MGPISATIQRVKNRHHFLVNLKTQKNVNIQKLINNVLKNIEIPKSIRLNVDIDPL
jgi:primosomal protein N'